MGIEEKTIQKLQEWQQEEGSLPQFLELYRELLLIQVKAKASVSLPLVILTKTEAKANIGKGIPLIKWDALSINWPAFQKFTRKSASLIREYTDPAHDTSADIAFDIPFLKESAKAWYEGASLSTCASAHGMSEELLSAAIGSALKPFLKTTAEALIGLVDQEQWRRGICPVCGGKPDFSFLDKDRGARWLVCSRCDTEWLFQRLECPYCGNTDQKELAFFTDDKELYRLYTCERCHKYIKAIDLRQAELEILIPLERVLTFDMDRQGQEKGYAQ